MPVHLTLVATLLATLFLLPSSASAVLSPASVATTFRKNPIVSVADGAVLAIGNVGRSILSAFGIGGS